MHLFFVAIQQKLKSTALVTTCSFGAFIGIGIYKNNSDFYDKVLMPIVQQCPPELCHRMAVIAFKYGLIPRQTTADADSLVSKFTKETGALHCRAVLEMPLILAIASLISLTFWHRN